jgi:hypothetical protein
MKTCLIIWSRDRACQVEALVDSMWLNDLHDVPMDIFIL